MFMYTGHELQHHAAANSYNTRSASGSLHSVDHLAPDNTSLAGGADGRTSTAGQKHGAWTDHFSDGETSDISFLIVGSTRTDNGSGADQDTLADWTTLANQAILLVKEEKTVWQSFLQDEHQ